MFADGAPPLLQGIAQMRRGNHTGRLPKGHPLPACQPRKIYDYYSMAAVINSWGNTKDTLITACFFVCRV